MDLPIELYHEIANHGVYREMLSIPAFARSLTVSSRLDYMIAMGHDMLITHYYIRWMKHGLTHRVGGPAIERLSGYKAWYVNGKRHREDGHAIERANGDKVWYLNNKRHREDGPAVEYADGGKAWYLNNKRHREDGPAIEWSDGSKEWWVNGIRVEPQI